MVEHRVGLGNLYPALPCDNVQVRAFGSLMFFRVGMSDRIMTVVGPT
jgi:hypothetical protein